MVRPKRLLARALAALAGSAILGAACAGSGTLSPTVSPGEGRPTPSLEEVEVARVVDGDTLRVLRGSGEERVRLIGVDTPEVSWYGGEAECFGEEAGRFAQRRLSDRSVGLAFDRDPRDGFDRLLAYVYVGAELFNLTLVEEGYATALPVSPNTSMAERFAEAEREAREAGRGLWSACPGP